MAFRRPASGGGWGCKIHHLVWFTRSKDSALIGIGCAHCTFVASHIDMGATTSLEQAARLVASSQRGHAQYCDGKPYSRRPPVRT